MFSTFSNYFSGANPDTTTKLKMKSGEFNTIPKVGDPKLIYKDATLSIGKTSQENRFQLVVTRIFDEGEEELEQENDEIVDEERVFLIDENMNFKFEVDDSDPNTQVLQIFSWQGLDKRGNIRKYEYLTSGEKAEFLKGFYEAVVSCMPEGKRKTSSCANNPDIIDLTNDLSKVNITKPVLSTDEIPIKTTETPKATSKLALELIGDLFILSAKERKYITVAEKAKIWISQEIEAVHNYWLSVSSINLETNTQKTHVCEQITLEMNPQLVKNESAFKWNYNDGDKMFSYAIVFPGLTEMEKFYGLLSRAIYENLNLQSYDKVTDKDKEYINEIYHGSSNYDGIESDSEEEKDDESSEEEDEQDTSSASNAKKEGTSANSQLAVGYKNNSFVVRGSMIDVYRHSANSLDFATAINNVSDLKGKSFNPNKVLLHDQDSSLILMNPLDQQTLFRMDLERGKVVEEWKVSDNVPCVDIFGSSKYSQLTPEKTLLGIGQNALYRIDPRINGPNKLVETELKQYLTKQNFSCATTTQKGEIAVASLKGEIKLFDRCGINAKTALPAMGDKIISLDVSNDGRYVIATCKTYLLLVDVLIHSDPQKRLGFAKSFPKAEKPIPKRLQLRPEDAAILNTPISFTPARFNIGSESLEKHIITSTGPYIVLWNFRKVKKGDLSSYSLRKYNDDVVADNFQYNQDKSIIVALPNDVTLASKRTLKATSEIPKPTRHLRSKENIVKTAY